MRVLIGGYVPEEGRVSIMRTAHSIARHATPFLDADDEVRLVDGRGKDHVQSPRAPKRVKLEKRLLAPARMAFQKADVLHLIDNDHAFGMAPWNFRRTLVTCHDLMPFLLDPTLKSVYGSPLGRFFCRRTLRNMARCAHVACVSEFTRQTLLKWSNCDPARTSVIPQAVEGHFRPLDPADPSRQAFLDRHGIAGKRVLLHVGSCLPYKNIPGLLDVFHKVVSSSDQDLVLLKVGGSFAEADENFIENQGLRPRMRHLSGLSDEDLVLAYNAADLLLWPSRFEGFGLPVIEAMACGTPVVCANGGALAEIAPPAARVYDPEDSEGMAEACIEILESDQTAGTLAEAGIAHARTFTWERAAAAYVALYRKIAGGG